MVNLFQGSPEFSLPRFCTCLLECVVFILLQNFTSAQDWHKLKNGSGGEWCCDTLDVSFGKRDVYPGTVLLPNRSARDVGC